MVFGTIKKQKPLKIMKELRNGTPQNLTAFSMNSYCVYSCGKNIQPLLNKQYESGVTLIISRYHTIIKRTALLLTD